MSTVCPAQTVWGRGLADPDVTPDPHRDPTGGQGSELRVKGQGSRHIHTPVPTGAVWVGVFVVLSH